MKLCEIRIDERLQPMNIFVFSDQEHLRNCLEKDGSYYRGADNYFTAVDGGLPFDFSNEVMPEEGSEGSDDKYEAIFSCKYNNTVKSLKGSPKEVGYFDMSSCGVIRTLEGAPQIVRYDVWLDFCWLLDDLKGIGKDYLVEIGNKFYAPGFIKSHALGLMLVKKLNYISRNGMARWNDEVEQVFGIMNRHIVLPDKDLLECQEDLISSGYKEFAKL